jgi:hypothetical protein
VYLDVVDQIIQELDNQFGEVNMEMLISMEALNPVNSFASYDAQMVTRLSQFYPNGITSMDLIRLEPQLKIFIDDIRKYYMFKCVNYLGELSIKLKKHVLFSLHASQIDIAPTGGDDES